MNVNVIRNYVLLLLCLAAVADASAQGYKNVTAQYVKNANQAASAGWTYTRQTVDGQTKTWSQTCKLYQGSYDSEIYAGDPQGYTTFAAFQKITLPKGTYHIIAKAFQRDVPSAVLFAEISGERQTVEVVSVYGQFATDPNSMETAAQAFNANMYLNDLAFSVDEDDTEVTIGFDGEFTAAKQWFIFGAMSLYQVQNEVSSEFPVDITPSLDRSYKAFSGLTGRYAKATSYIHEKYSGSNFPVGNQITQTFTGLQNGVYEVVVNANASTANGVGTLPATDPYVYAGDVKATVKAVSRSSVSTVGRYTLKKVLVTDGTMPVGFYNQSEGGNWYLYNVMSVKYCGSDLSALVNNLESVLSAAKALTEELMNADVKVTLVQAIQTAENNQDTDSQSWLENTISSLNTAITSARESHTAYVTTIIKAVDELGKQAVTEGVGDVLKEKYDNGAYVTQEDVFALFQKLEIAGLPRTEGTDYTSVLINSGFEWGNTAGWLIQNYGDDTAVHTTSNTTYAYSGTEGNYLFNTWATKITTLDIGQTVKGLPNGYYTITAVVAGYGDGAPITLSANSSKTSVSPSNTDVEGEVAVGHKITLENVLVSNGTLTFTVANSGKGKTFFKADAFTLTYLRPYEAPTNFTDLHFTLNIENDEVARYLSEVTYTTASPTAIGNYDTNPGARNDQPSTISIPIPEMATDATLTISLSSDYAQATTLTIPAGTVTYELTNLLPQQTYYYKVENEGTTVANGDITTTGHVRMVKADSGFNIRDIGGWLTCDGNRLRYGKIYRGGEMNANHVMNESDLAVMASLGIKAEVDFREDVDIAGFGIDASAIDGAAYTYENLSRWSEDALNFDNEKFRDAFQLIYQTVKAGDAAYFHCIYGADRTGCFSFLIEGLLGLPVDQLYKDYELTSFSSAGLREKTGIDHKIQYINALVGENLQEKFFNYWRGAVGISEDVLFDFIDIMTEGESSIKTQALSGLPAKTVDDGEYYLYFPTFDQFLGRGLAYGTRGVTSHFGIPAMLRTNGVGVSTLQFLDNRLFFGSDGFADKDMFYNTVSWFVEQRGEYFVLKSLGGNYLSYRGATRLEAATPDEAVPVVFVTKEKQKAMLDEQRQTNMLKAAADAGIEAADEEQLNSILAGYEAVENVVEIPSATSGSTDNWVISEPYARDESSNYGNAYNVGAYGGELYQKNASVTQTVSVPHAGLYKLTLNAFYRQGTNANCYALGQAGYDNLSVAQVSVNDTYYAQIPSWYSGCTASNIPDNVDDAKSLIDKGAYAVELYAYVDESKRATITIDVSNFTPFGWCLFNNFKLTWYDDDGIADDIAEITSGAGKLEDMAVFDLTGRRVKSPSRGVYIVNGKKVMVK